MAFSSRQLVVAVYTLAKVNYQAAHADHTMAMTAATCSHACSTPV